MKHTCFISFKAENIAYKEYLQKYLSIDMIDKSLDEAIDSYNEDYVLRKLREDYISRTTVTIHLIGSKSAESLGWNEQKYIKRELQASLFHGEGNTQNGILGIVLPEVYELVYGKDYICGICGNTHSFVNVYNTTVKEFSYNYFIPNGKCCWTEDERFCILVKWDDFIKEPETFIELAFQKRTHPIADKTRVRP